MTANNIFIDLLLLMGILCLMLIALYMGVLLYRMFTGERSDNTLSESAETTAEAAKPKSEKTEEPYSLVGKSDSSVSVSFPIKPTLSPSVKLQGDTNNFASENASQPAPSDEEEVRGKDEDNEMDIEVPMDEPDEDEILREELLLSRSPQDEVSPSAIFARELTRMRNWSRDDEAFAEEDHDKVASTLGRLKDTDLMEKFTAQLALQEQAHRRLLERIRQMEADEGRQDDNPPPSSPGTSDKVEQQPLSFYL